MPQRTESDSRRLLGRLRDTMAEEAKGQERLDKITHLIADSMGTEVCSIYLFRDQRNARTLCATQGLNRESVHQTRLKAGRRFGGFGGKIQ
jgi:phosphotransferase system enzyme I (PtsP)